MNGERGTFQVIARHLAAAVRPLTRDFSDPEAFRVLMWRLGWDVQGLPPGYLTVANAATRAAAAAEALADDAGPDEVVALVEAVGDVYRAVEALDEAPPGVDPAAMATLARNLFEYLLADYLYGQVPRLFTTLELFGVIRFEPVEPAGSRPGFVRTRFEWELLPAALSDPASIPALVLGWGTASFNFPRAAELLGELTLALGLPSSVDRVGSDYAQAIQSQATGTPAALLRYGLTVPFFDLPVGERYEQVGVMVTELPAEGDALPGVVVVPLVPDGIALEIDLGNRWSFRLRAGTDLAEQLGIVLRPDGIGIRYPFAPGRPLPAAGFGFALVSAPEGPSVLLGDPGGIRLELAGLTLSLGVDTHGGAVGVKLGVEPRGLGVILSGAGLDGFLGEMLGDRETRVDLPLGISWSSRTGLDFRAGAGLEISYQPHLDLGALRFDRIDVAVRLAAGAGTTPQLDLRAAVALSGALGPVAYSVDRLGVHLPIRFQPGNAGPLDVDFDVLWPAGMSLSVDSGVVTGGGFLYFDPDQAQYAGALRLEFEKFTLNAIGLLTTRMPDGSRGFSLLVVVQASGFTPIQLGFGFTLNGVGGLLGVNRTVAVDVLRAGVKNRTLDAVLFSPDDPTPRAPQLISTLRSVFPPAVSQYVFGPMALLGWGAPVTLVTIEIALILELPAPIRLIVLGRMRATLPDPEHPIVSINLDVVGVIDFDRRELSVDASLYDSTLGPFALSGNMAARANWGANPDFAMALGGFHPAFKPPPGFPELRRLALALSTGDNPRLRMETYLALTSNTVQGGARLELIELAQVLRETLAGARSITPDDLSLPEQPGTAAADLPEVEGRAVVAETALHTADSALGAAIASPTGEALRSALLAAAALGVAGAVPLSPFGDTPADRADLRMQAAAAQVEVRRRITQLQGLAAPSPGDTRGRVDHALARIRMAFGGELRAVPRYTPPPPGDRAQVDVGFPASAALQAGDGFAAVRWFQRLTRIRDGAQRLGDVLLYADALGGADTLRFQVAQLPAVTGDRWLALPFAADTPPAGRVSLVAHLPAGPLDPARPLAGLLIEQFTEVLPAAAKTTGLALHYDQPSAAPPQAIVLAVPPRVGEDWTLETLRATVHETLDLAKLRMVDLDALQEAGHFVPATYLAFNAKGVTVATDFLTGLGVPLA